jgi:polysaccharide export outer membrane protein
MNSLTRAALLLVCSSTLVSAQIAPAASGSASASTPPQAAASAAASVALPPDYVIGPDDVLSIVFWRDKNMSLDVTVRPDGKITLPLLNDITAAGLTPTDLRDRVTEAAGQYLEDPNVTVIVRQVNSRKVFVTGEVARPGPYPLTGPTTVLQMLATAGGVQEYADLKNIAVIRVENGRAMTYRFNYKDVARRKNLRQNIELKPGDTIIVP